MSLKTRRGAPKRSYTRWIIPALVLVTAVVGYYIFTQSGTASSGSPLNNTPASSAVLNDLSGVSFGTLSQVGSGGSGISSPTAIANAPTLTLNGKPEILYMGAEYCPYCAAERWAMIVALDKFGNFTGLKYMQSNTTPEVFPNTATFTFVGSNYSSPYISFATVEQADRTGQPLQTASSQQTALLNAYDTSGSIPFVDFANKYVITSAQFLPSALRVGNSENGAPYNWTQISSQLNNASSIFAVNVDGAANRLISAICKIDGGAPASICSQSFASLLSYTRTAAPGSSQLLISDVGPSAQAASPAPAPGRLTYWF